MQCRIAKHKTGREKPHLSPTQGGHQSDQSSVRLRTKWSFVPFSCGSISNILKGDFNEQKQLHLLNAIQDIGLRHNSNCEPSIFYFPLMINCREYFQRNWFLADWIKAGAGAGINDLHLGKPVSLSNGFRKCLFLWKSTIICYLCLAINISASTVPRRCLQMHILVLGCGKHVATEYRQFKWSALCFAFHCNVSLNGKVCPVLCRVTHWLSAC